MQTSIEMEDDAPLERVSATGLSAAEARARLAAEGPNLLPSAVRRHTLAIALEVLREPMFLLLVAGCAIYLLLGDVREALVLAASVLVVMAITVVQERRTERALEALRDLSSPRARVIRDGAEQRIAGAEVVRGDLLILSEGDRVPADARLLAANELMADESLLTGESVPVEKLAGAGDAREQHVYSGTLVVKGRGRAEVLATGPRTEFGRIGATLAGLPQEKTTLQRETARIVRIVALGAVALSLLLALFHVAMRGEWLPGILAGVTLAMAVLPEEFPVVLTVFLALGAWRISRHGVLTRRMPAIETLGAATVLCVDKTGTLTENRMALAEAAPASGIPRPALLEAAALACEPDPFDPMERALLAAAADGAPHAIRQRSEWRLEHDYPFSSGFLAVCHGWRAPDGSARAAMKGAPETVIALCRMNEDARRDALDEVARAAQRGLRLLGVARADWRGGAWPSDPAALGLEFLGFVALADPLRATVPEAVAQCRRAGIRVVMITGDHAATALAIAHQAGIASDGRVLGGDQIAAMDDAALAAAVREVRVFSRISPQQKLRLVTAYKQAGEVVAMTGDGVNDAPALKAAHIGIAMGRRGTDVAREASSLVLLEDDFGSIVATVRLGRRIYENIRNAMRYIVGVHVPTAGMSFLPLAFGWPLFLFPVHIVFLEFVIDPTCAVVFEAEASEEGAMRRPPRDPAQPLFNLEMLLGALLLGAAVLACVVLVYAWAQGSGRSEGEVHAIGFAAIVFGNLALILAHRSRERSILAKLARPNPAFWWVVLGALAALAAAIYFPPLAQVFRFAPLAPGDVAIAAGAGLAGVVAMETLRLVRRA
jgi:Ca2+-transporting ATPase